MATRQNLVDMAKTKVSSSGSPLCGYAWAVKDGSILTQDLLNSLIASYGKSHYDFYDKGVHVLASKWMGKQVFDCSGFVHWCCKQLGVSVEKSSTAQLNYSCYTISKDELQPGDLCFEMSSRYNTSAPKGPASKDGPKNPKGTTKHVAIYVGNGVVIEAANTKMGVVYGKLGSRFDAFGKITALDGNSVTIAPDTTNTPTSSSYGDLAGWTKEYIALNLDTIVGNIAGAGSTDETKRIVKETIISNYLLLSNYYDIGSESEGLNTVDLTEAFDQAIVTATLATLSAAGAGNKLTLPIKLGFNVNVNKNMGLYYLKSENVQSSLSTVQDFSKITIEKAIQNKFHPTMVLILYYLASKWIASIPFFKTQQKIVIAKGFTSLKDNDATLDDHVMYSAHCCGLAADIYVDSQDTFNKAKDIAMNAGIPNISFNAATSTIHIDIGYGGNDA